MIERATDVLDASPFRPDARSLAPGSLAGSWRITSRIAAGGCGVVYAARHVVLDRVVAIKVLHDELSRSRDIVTRFLQEARAIDHIRHPNIVGLHDVGMLVDGRPYLAMELLAPNNLEDHVAVAGRLRLDDIVAIVVPICEALDAAHRAGYIHRDVKARNIGFAGSVPKLLDFGIAKLLEAGRDSGTCTVRMGTPQAMAPEQIRGERIDARADVYALGVLLYQLATGRCPFDAALPAEIERMHLDAPPPRPSRLAPVSPALDAVVLRALAKSPHDRFPSARAFAAGLAAAAGAPGSHTMCPAVAIRVTIDLPDRAVESDLDAAATATAWARGVLEEAGFTPVLATATSLIAARTLAETDDPAAVRAGAESLIGRFEAEPMTRADVRCGSAELAGRRFVGGELFAAHTWKP